MLSSLRPFFLFPSFFRALLPGCKESRGRLAAGILLFTLHYPLFTGGEAASAQSADIIQTIAGSRAIGDGGAAASASLRFPSGVDVDSAGNIYIADAYNHRIRKVTASTGAISTVAGTGSIGYGGDSGPATAARLSFPDDVAVDSDGNLYIADTTNHRIRKVDTAGDISTFAGTGTSGDSGDGGAATAAQLNFPSGVAVDSSNNLYIADTSNHRIRKVDVTTNIISTVAGTGTAGLSNEGIQATTARLSYPHDIDVDNAGNLYIADTRNFRFRKVDTMGVITTIAGTGTLGYTGDGGAATAARISQPRGAVVDGDGNLYIADANNYRIRKVDASTNAISTVAGTVTGGFSGDGGAATGAELFLPYSVALDSAGNLYIADWGNHRIRKVTASGTISTVAGTGNVGDGGSSPAAQLALPQDVAADAAGNLYIADTWNNRIRKVDASTGAISTVAGDGTFGFSGDNGPASSAQLKLPRGVATDAAGNLYISDTNNFRIRKVDASTGVISTVAGDGTYAFGGDNGPASSAQLRSPYGLDVDGSGNIYFVGGRSYRIRRVDASTGTITTVAGGGTNTNDGIAATTARLSFIDDMAVDSAGNIYIANRGGHRIRRVDASTNIISTFAGSSSGLVGFSGDGGAAASARLNQPYGVAADAAGNIYIADTNNNRIRRVDAVTGNISTVAGSGQIGYNGEECAATAAHLFRPRGVAVDGAGNLYVADRLNHRVRKVSRQPPGSDPLGPCSITIFEPEPEPEPEIPGQPGQPDPGPSVEPVGVSELSFAPAPDADPSAPMSRTLTLRAQGGATDFEVLPSARWIEISRWEGGASWKGRLAAGETITLRVTVNPLGLRPGTHRGYVYIRAGNNVARVRIVLEVPPPTGPDVSESGGVVNAARMSAYGEAGLFGPQALPAAPGSLVAVRGVNFLAGGRAAAESFPLPTSLGGVRVLFDGAAAPLFSAGPQRIEAQLPWALRQEALAAGGLALAEVVVETADGESSWPRQFHVGAHGPGVFTASGSGQGQALVLFAGTTDVAAPLGFREGSRPARAGDVLEIYATGLGAVEPPAADGMNSCAPDGLCLADGSNAVLRHTTARPRVWIGAHVLAPGNVHFSGLAPSLAGVNLVVVEIPPNLAPSSAAELRLDIGGRMSQSGATIAIE